MQNFYRWALLKTWVQAAISGCPTIMYGFRNDEGEIGEIKIYKTRKIPKMKQVTWNSRAPPNLLDRFLTFLVENTLAGGEYMVEYSGNRSKNITLRMFP